MRKLATQQDRSRGSADVGTELGRRRSPDVVAKCYRLTAAVLRSAVSNCLLAFNPCEDIRLPPRRKHACDGRIITREELVTVLLPVVPDRYPPQAAPDSAGERHPASAPMHSTLINTDSG